MTSNTAEFSSSAASRAAFFLCKSAQRHGKRRVKQDCERNKQRSRSTDYTPQAKMQIRFLVSCGYWLILHRALFGSGVFCFFSLQQHCFRPPCSPTLHSLLFIVFFLKYSAHGMSVTRNAGANADNCGYLRQNCKYLMFGLPSGAHCGII